MNDNASKLAAITRMRTVLLVIYVSPLFFLFAYFGDPGRGRAATIMAALILLVAQLYWNYKREAWFWLTLVVVVVFHTSVLFLVPWNNNNYPGLVLLPLALPDFGVIYGAFRLVERSMI
jgi:hypothetical protein